VDPPGLGRVSAEEWFSGGERLPYDRERASFDDSSPLRVMTCPTNVEQLLVAAAHGLLVEAAHGT
jgi:hypothetical protein